MLDTYIVVTYAIILFNLLFVAGSLFTLKYMFKAATKMQNDMLKKIDEDDNMFVENMNDTL